MAVVHACLQTDAVDPKSRHKGKLETESLLTSRGVNWTSIRPVYIYGPLNYNPVEEWFFHRLKAGRPIPIPGAGNQITQLGHVKVYTYTIYYGGLWRCARNSKNIIQS